MNQPPADALRRRKERFLQGRITLADAAAALSRYYDIPLHDPRVQALAGRVFADAEARGLSAGDANGFRDIIVGLAGEAQKVGLTANPAALQLALAERDNIHGPGHALPGSWRHPSLAWLSSMRFDGMQLGAGSSRSAQTRIIDDARVEAVRLGIPWAANNYELLQLGPQAIRALREVGIRRETFERMTGARVGFRGDTAGMIAQFAKKHGLTPQQANRLFGRISDAVESISGGDKAIQRELDDATRKFVTGPDTPEGRKALEDAYAKHADTPQKKAAARAATQEVFNATDQRNADVAATGQKETTAGVKETAVAAEKGDLNALAAKPAQQPTTPKPDTTKPTAAPPKPAAPGSKP